MTQFTQRAPGVGVSLPNAEANYRQMLRIRRFEEQVYQLFVRNVVHGTTHLGIGQEAIAVGFAAAMRPDDYTLATYRGHAHALARGASLVAGFGELFGRSNGLCKGKGGSMHFTDVAHGVVGSYAIVGASSKEEAGYILRDAQ